jgi:hypothetical protein
VAHGWRPGALPTTNHYQSTPNVNPAVELFIIHCTTCKARLKVQSESAIGDILACPKCSSMVHVVPPIGWKRSAGPRTALRESAIPPAPIEISKPLPAKPKAAAVAPPLPVRGAPAPRPLEVQPQAALPSIAATVSPLPLTRAPSRVANTFWAVAVARAKRDWMLYSGGLAAGVLLGIAGLWLAVNTAEVAPLAVADEPLRARQPVAPSTLVARQTNPPPSVRERMVAFNPSITDEPANPDPQATPAAADEIGETAATDRSHESSDVSPAVVQTEATSESAVARSKPSVPALKLDPVLPANSAVTPPPSDPATEQPTTADAIAGADEPAKIRPAATIDPTSTATPAGRSPSATEIEERLKSTQLPSVQFVRAPLAEFVEFIGDLTRLRITIDDAALAAMGKGRHSLLSIKLTNTTAAKALGAGLKSLGLTCVARDGKLVVTTAQGQSAEK